MSIYFCSKIALSSIFSMEFIASINWSRLKKIYTINYFISVADCIQTHEHCIVGWEKFVSQP